MTPSSPAAVGYMEFIYGPESSDVPLEEYKLFADYEMQKTKAAFDQAAKDAGKAAAGGGGALRVKNVPVKAHNRAGPAAKGTTKPAVSYLYLD